MRSSKLILTSLLTTLLVINIQATTAAALDLAPAPVVTATLDPQCGGADKAIPTVVVNLTNHSGYLKSVALRDNGVPFDEVHIQAGQTLSIHTPKPAWEDTTKNLSVTRLDQTIVSLNHHFDCSHAIITADSAFACAGKEFGIEVTNSGNELTPVAFTVDDGIADVHPFGPGHSQTLKFTLNAGQVVKVIHEGEVVHSRTVLACLQAELVPDPPAEPPVETPQPPPPPPAPEGGANPVEVADAVVDNNDEAPAIPTTTPETDDDAPGREVAQASADESRGGIIQAWLAIPLFGLLGLVALVLLARRARDARS